MVLKRLNENEVLSGAFLAAFFTTVCILVSTVPILLELDIVNEIYLDISLVGVFSGGIIFLILLGVSISRTTKKQEKDLSTDDNTSLIHLLYVVGFIAILGTFILSFLFIIASFFFTGLALSSATAGTQQDIREMRRIFDSIFLLNQVTIFVVNICFSSIPVLLGKVLLRARLRKFLWAGFISNLAAHFVGAGTIIYLLMTLQEEIYGYLLIGQYLPLGLAFIGYTLFSISYYRSIGKEQ